MLSSLKHDKLVTYSWQYVKSSRGSWNCQRVQCGQTRLVQYIYVEKDFALFPHHTRLTEVLLEVARSIHTAGMEYAVIDSEQMTYFMHQ